MSAVKRTLFSISVGLNVVIIAAIGYLLPKALDGYSTFESTFEAWIDRRTGAFAASRSGKVDIAFIGDSITHEGLWSEYYPQHRIINRGISTAKVQDLLPILPEIAQHTPSKVFVLLGINDLNAGRSVEEISADYKTFYARVAELLPDTQVHIQSIIPVNDDWRIDINPKDLEKLNQGLAQIAKDRNYSFIDLTSAMASDTGLLKASITNDGIHLTQAGYRLWLDMLDPLILPPSTP